MTNTVYIMSGIPGSGKSTRGRKIKQRMQDTLESVKVVSNDDYFMIDGEYKFSNHEYTRDGGARDKCFSAFKDAVTSGYSCIIVDNTNTTWDRCEPYIKLALTNGYNIIFAESETDWKWDIEICTERNLHQVSKEVIQQMRNRYLPRDICVDKCLKLCDELGIINMEPLYVNSATQGIIKRVQPLGDISDEFLY